MSTRNYQIDLSTHPFCVAMRERRLVLGYSFRELALRIGSASRSYLKELEEGKWVVSVEMGMCICQILNIPTYFCMDYIQQGTMQRVRNTMQKDYTKWIQTVPEQVLGNLLDTDGSLMVHQNYYNEELSKC